MPGERIVEHLSERAPTDAGNHDKNAVRHLSGGSLNAGSQDNHDDPTFCEKYKIFTLKFLSWSVKNML